jgi:hypothetical protein
MMLHGTWPKDGVRRVGTAKESARFPKLEQKLMINYLIILINHGKPTTFLSPHVIRCCCGGLLDDLNAVSMALNG